MNFNVITIEREYASGGREIGRTAAERLNLLCYEGEVLQLAAGLHGTSTQYIQHLDEKAPNSLLYSLSLMANITPVDNNSLNLSPENTLQQEEARIINGLAERGNCVIIGRCAGAILKKRANVLRIFIHADKESRRKRAVELYGIRPQEADSTLKRYDRKRASYYSFYSDQKWDAMNSYELILDSGRLGIERCVDIIAAAYGTPQK